MNGDLNLIQSKVRTAEALEQAKRHRVGLAGDPRRRDVEAVVRLAREGDWHALQRLAQLEGRRLPAGPALVAVQEGEILAAVSLGGGGPIADPFRPTAELVELLGIALARLREDSGRRRWGLWGMLRRSRPGRSAASAPPIRETGSA